MGVIKRKKIWKQHALMQHDNRELHERALRFVDTRGVVLRAAEAELREAIAGTPGAPDARARASGWQRRGAPSKRPRAASAPERSGAAQLRGA